MARSNIQEWRTKKFLAIMVEHACLGYRNKILAVTDIISEAFVLEGVDFAKNNEARGPDAYLHTGNIVKSVVQNVNKKEETRLAFSIDL